MEEFKIINASDARTNYRLMLLDDDIDRLKALTDVCMQLEQEIVPVTSVDSGITFLETKDHVDVIIAEAYMHREPIFDFLKRMHEEPAHREVPILLIAVNPGEVGKQFIDRVDYVAKVLGAKKVLHMKEFDGELLLREIVTIIPLDDWPKKVQDPGGAY
jgi:PleD family two-component response regulator